MKAATSLRFRQRLEVAISFSPPYEGGAEGGSRAEQSRLTTIRNPSFFVEFNTFHKK